MTFIDTGAFLARYVAADQHHAAAAAAWAELAESGQRCATSNFVVDEFLTLLARRAGPAFAAERGRRILGSSTLEILRPGPREEQAAVELLEKFGDQGVSFTDCVSFVLMRQAKLKRVFGFDRHFVAAGFDLWPR